MFTTGRSSGGSGRDATVRSRSWRKACTLTPPRRWPRCLFGALIPLALAGCQTKFVTVHCVTPEQARDLKAAEPPKIADKLTGKADEDVRTIAGSNIRLRSWGTGLLGVVQGCAKP